MITAVTVRSTTGATWHGAWEDDVEGKGSFTLRDETMWCPTSHG